MKKIYTSFLLIALLLVNGIVTPALAGSQTYGGEGEISAIDMEHRTVVVEVPIEMGTTFTVGGPLAPKATLKKNHAPAMLDDFSVGDQVKVQWRPVESGHMIEMLEGK